MIMPRLDVPIAYHGGRLALDAPREIADFSVCLNAFGPAPIVREAIRDAAIHEYPDPDSRVAREAAAAAWRCPIDEIALGAGAAELIDAVCRAYLAPGDSVRIERPAFAEYERAARLCGAIEDVNDRNVPPRLIFICSPSNPEGKLENIDKLRAIADDCATHGSLLILDQAYDAFSDEPVGTPALAAHPAVLHLRSLTKEHALAGVRVAYAVGPSRVIAAINAMRVPWSASSLAQAAAVAAFTPEAQSHAATTIAALRAEALRLRVECTSVGYDVSHSATHFFLVRVGDATAARRLLLDEARILVRDCTSFGLSDRVRVAARTRAANDQLLYALERLAPRLLP